MKKTDAEILDYYDEEVVKRIVEKYAFPEKEALAPRRSVYMRTA